MHCGLWGDIPALEAELHLVRTAGWQQSGLFKHVVVARESNKACFESQVQEYPEVSVHVCGTSLHPRGLAVTILVVSYYRLDLKHEDDVNPN